MSNHRRFYGLFAMAVVAAAIVTISHPMTAFSQEGTPSRTISRPVPSPGAFPMIPDFGVPSQVVLCGEKFPLGTRDVFERMDYELLLAAHSKIQVFLWLRRGGRYFPHIEKRLTQEGLPTDLKYLAVAESDLRPHVRSPARALGTWQFIEYTGRRYGLKKDQDFDERLNFEQSTEAAIKFLKRLKGMFGKWTLAMAAYNCGEGCVAKAIKEQEVRDYFRLNLPRETERYVFRIAAIKLILENPKQYGYDMNPDRAYKPIRVDKVMVNLDQDVHMTRAAKAVGTDYKVIRELNPEIKGSHLPEGVYQIQVPSGLGPKMTAYLKSVSPGAASAEDKKQGVSAEKTTAKYYVVRRGDTLAQVSRKTGVPIGTLRSLNRIRGSHIWVGQKLRLSK